MFLPTLFDAPHARATLRMEVVRASPGEPFLAAVEIDTDPHWHVYWRNPGDSGVPTTVEWSVPKGWRVEPLEYPAPRRFAPGGVAAYGYEGKTLLLARVTPSSKPGALAARVRWLVCSEACVQGGASLSRTLGVGSRREPSPDAGRLKSAQVDLPRPAVGWQIVATRDRKSVSLVAHPAGRPAMRVEFFPTESGLVDQSKPFEATLLKGRYVLKMDVSPFPEPRSRLRGLLVPQGDRRRAVYVDTSFVTGD